MKTKKILIIQGNPNPQSLCNALANAYEKGAKENGAQLQRLNLFELEFSPNLNYGYKQRTELEPDLLKSQELISWAEHIVFIYPVWWGNMPAILKGFFDRVFLPGFAFKYRANSPWWDKLLTGRSARQIVTLGMPNWYYWLFYGAPSHRAMKQVTLNFSGIKPVKTTVFSPVRQSNEKQRENWLQKSYSLGKRFA